MITPDSVIDALGGTKAVAEALSLDVSTVSCWRGRGKEPARVPGGIPPAHWLAVVRLAADSAPWITLEVLAEMGAREPVEARV